MTISILSMTFTGAKSIKVKAGRVVCERRKRLFPTFETDFIRFFESFRPFAQVLMLVELCN